MITRLSVSKSEYVIMLQRMFSAANENTKKKMRRLHLTIAGDYFASRIQIRGNVANAVMHIQLLAAVYLGQVTCLFDFATRAEINFDHSAGNQL